MAFVKHFCRLITDTELEDDDVIDFFDVVQSVVSTKMVAAYSADGSDVVSVDVIAYVNSDEQNVYEIVLDEDIDQEEGDQISQLLLEQFPDIDFDFEASVEV
jgi:hypothetical protein